MAPRPDQAELRRQLAARAGQVSARVPPPGDADPEGAGAGTSGAAGSGSPGAAGSAGSARGAALGRDHRLRRQADDREARTGSRSAPELYGGADETGGTEGQAPGGDDPDEDEEDAPGEDPAGAEGAGEASGGGGRGGQAGPALGGVIVGLFAWALTLNWVRGGKAQATAWLKAKFFNEVPGSS